MVFDATEPNNPSSTADTRIEKSNISQWLNSDKPANHWYSAQSEYDAPPDYQSQNAFLKDWTDKEKSTIVANVWTVFTSQSGGSNRSVKSLFSERTFTAKVTLLGRADGNSVTLSGADLSGGLDIFSESESSWLIDGIPYRGKDVSHAAASVFIASKDTSYATPNDTGIAVRPIVNVSPDTPVYADPDENGVYSFCLENGEGQ